MDIGNVIGRRYGNRLETAAEGQEDGFVSRIGIALQIPIRVVGIEIGAGDDVILVGQRLGKELLPPVHSDLHFPERREIVERVGFDGTGFGKGLLFRLDDGERIEDPLLLLFKLGGRRTAGEGTDGIAAGGQGDGQGEGGHEEAFHLDNSYILNLQIYGFFANLPYLCGKSAMKRLRLIFLLLPTLLLGSTVCGQDFSFYRPPVFHWGLSRPGPDTLKMVFVGDIMLHQKQIDNARERGKAVGRKFDFSRFFEKVGDRIAGADIAVGNLESPLTDPPYSGYPVFATPDDYAEYLADIGFDVILLANNHVLDKGKAGILHTIGTLDRMEKEGSVRYTGIGADAQDDTLRNPLIINWKGISVALINTTYGTNMGMDAAWPKIRRNDRAEIRSAIDRARRQGARVIIALPHWGIEYELHHSQSQHEFARFLAESGADIIIGAHPHVVQDMEVFEVDGRRVPCYYSLGNAVSNMSATNTRIELMLHLRIIRGTDGEIVLSDPEAEYLWCTLPGRLTDSYATISVREWLPNRDAWIEPADYDNMVATYDRVRTATGVPDKP